MKRVSMYHLTRNPRFCSIIYNSRIPWINCDSDTETPIIAQPILSLQSNRIFLKIFQISKIISCLVGCAILEFNQEMICTQLWEIGTYSHITSNFCLTLTDCSWKWIETEHELKLIPTVPDIEHWQEIYRSSKKFKIQFPYMLH